MDRVFLDTNVLIGGILGNGVNMKLLQLAAASVLFEPVISEVVVLEFLENCCRKGVTKKRIIIPDDEINEFFKVLSPMLDFDNIERISIGREMWTDYYIHSKQPIERFLYDLLIVKKGVVRPDILATIEHSGVKVEDTDPGDIHVMFGAIELECNILATHNVDDFPKIFGNVEVVRPGKYYDYLVRKD